MRQRHNSVLEVIRQPGWDQWLSDVLKLTDFSDSLPRTLLARCLLVASAFRVAVSAVARQVANAGRETVRKGLTPCSTDVRQLEHRLAAGFRRILPRAIRRCRVPLAIDIHRRPYYGDHKQTTGVTGAKSEGGTHWFWSYATAVSLLPGHRHTLAITTVGPDDTLTAVVQRLLAQVCWTDVRIQYVLLDRAFYAVGVIKALEDRGLRFIIPMVRRAGDSQRFFRRGCRGWFEHTVQAHRRHEGTAQVRVAVVPGSDGNRPQVFACSSGFTAVTRVALVYGRRFGIESSYRQLGECLAVTTSRDAAYRLLLLGVSLLIRGWWAVTPGTTLAQWRWALINVFTPSMTSPHTNATQTDTPQQHAAL